MIQQSIKTRKALRREWAKRASPGYFAASGAFEGAASSASSASSMSCRKRGAAYAGARRAEFVVLVGEELARLAQLPPVGAPTCDPLEAHRWLHEARERVSRVGGGDGPQVNALDGLCIGYRRGAAEPWRRQGPLLCLPELALEGGRLDPVPLVATPLAASPRAARARLRMLLRRGGLDAAAAASLLDRYEGYFPSIEVGAAQILHARLGGDLTWLRWLDLRAMLWDLISSAALWTLPDRGARGWPPGLHIFAS